MTKNHHPYHICPLLQNPAVGQVQDHKSYHSYYPSHRHQNLGVIKPDVSDTLKDIQVSPITPHHTSTVHLFGLYFPRDIQFHNIVEFSPNRTLN